MKWRWYIVVRWFRSLACLAGGHAAMIHLGDKTERDPKPLKKVHKFRTYGCPRCGSFFVQEV